MASFSGLPWARNLCSAHVGNGRARGISRLLPVTLGAGVLSLVGSGSRGGLGCLDAAEANPDFGFLLGWVIGPWIFLECLPTRLLHYFLPAYPACALLAAWMVEAVVDEDVTLRRWPLGRLGLGLLGGIGIAGTIVLLAAGVTFPVLLRLPLAFLAVVLGEGTMTGMLWLHWGSTRQAGIGLGVTWAVFMLIVGGWLIPAAEPYRTSRRIVERLAVLSARTGIEAVLLNYQEPGVIYAMAKPVATVRDRAGFYDLLDRKTSPLTVIKPRRRRLLATGIGSM